MALQDWRSRSDFERKQPRVVSVSTSGSGNSVGRMFSHPKDFTPVCTTELGYMAEA
jgi:alkyl hydroperoxide reductase subunit AhpC